MTDAENTTAAVELDNATSRAIPLVEEAAWFAVDTVADVDDAAAQVAIDALVAELGDAARAAFWTARRDGAI